MKNILTGLKGIFDKPKWKERIVSDFTPPRPPSLSQVVPNMARAIEGFETRFNRPPRVLILPEACIPIEAELSEIAHPKGIIVIFSPLLLVEGRVY